MVMTRSSTPPDAFTLEHRGPAYSNTGLPMIRHPAAVVAPRHAHDNNQHAANENLPLRNLWDGIEIFAMLFAELEK